MMHEFPDLEAFLVEALKPHRNEFNVHPHVVGIGLGVRPISDGAKREYVINVYIDTSAQAIRHQLMQVLPTSLDLELKSHRHIRLPIVIEELGDMGIQGATAQAQK